MNKPLDWAEYLNQIPGTFVSAGVETIQVFPLDGRVKNLVLIVSEHHPWVTSWRNLGIRVFCLEEQSGAPENNTAKLLLNSRTTAFMKTLDQPVSILMFKPDAESAQKLRQLGFNVIGCDPAAARRLENKLLFPAIARQACVQIPSTKKLLLDSENTLIRKPPLSPFPFICQFAKGFSGNRTFLVTSTEDWAALLKRFPNRYCRVSQKIEGDTWTVNACVFKDGFTLVSHPFLQETITIESTDGLPKRIGSAGNHWGEFSSEVARQTQGIAHKTGSVLHQKGFFGFWGMDIILEKDTGLFYAIEINPRITASTPVLTPMEMSGDAPPLIAAHLSTSMDLNWPWRNAPAAPNPGGQRIYRPGGLAIPRKLEKCDTGIYRFTGNNVKFLRPGWNPGNLENGECLVWKPQSTQYASESMRVVYRGSLASLPSLLPSTNSAEPPSSGYIAE